MHTKIVRYGTTVMPTIARNILAQFPVERITGASCSNEYFRNLTYHKNERHFKVLPESLTNGRYPSVSTILGCTTSHTALYRWQLNMIKQLGGLGAFKKYMRSRIEMGIAYHSCIQKLLNYWQQHNALNDDMVAQIMMNLNETACAYVQSVLPILRTLKCDTMELERPINHHGACYCGRFDAIVGYKDALFLIDWKTSSASGVAKKELEKMYNDPLQIAAYIGAVNSDPTFNALPEIRHGAVVIAQEDGSMATVVEMTEFELEVDPSKIFLQK